MTKHVKAEASRYCGRKGGNCQCTQIGECIFRDQEADRMHRLVHTHYERLARHLAGD